MGLQRARRLSVGGLPSLAAMDNEDVASPWNALSGTELQALKDKENKNEAY